MGRVLAPGWKVDKKIDLDYHVRHSALPRPGGERELGILVSRLHSNPLDFARPLWECHVIEGLENNRFALYTKMHHSMIDGISGVRLMQRVLTTDPEKGICRHPGRCVRSAVAAANPTPRPACPVRFHRPWMP